MANALGAIVIDTDYAKAPEIPFPRAFEDIQDVVAYIQTQPHEYDLSRFTIGGFSSGGNLALATAVNAPKGTFKAVVVWYPVTNWHIAASERRCVPIPKGNPGFSLASMWLLFENSYIPPGADRSDTRLSPFCAPVEAFPPVTLIVSHSMGFVHLTSIDDLTLP